MLNIKEIKESIHNKSTDLLNHVINFEKDIDSMKMVSDKIISWIDNGVDVGSCIDPLQRQIQSWEDKMNSLFNEFKNNIIGLKKVDDRIVNLDSEVIDDLENIVENKSDNWVRLIEIYNSLFNSLEEDILVLHQASSDLSKYQSLGVKLGDAIANINGQVDEIYSSVIKSTDQLDTILSQIEKECGKVEIDTLDTDEAVDTIDETGLVVKSSHVETYSGTKKEVTFDHSVINNNESKFELHLKFLSNSHIGNPVMIGCGEGGNRIYFGWQVNGDGRLLLGLGGGSVLSLNNYANLAGTEMSVKFIQYGNKTGRFVVNTVEEDLIDIPEYTYTSTGTFYYNGHYSSYPSHIGTVYEYLLYA